MKKTLLLSLFCLSSIAHEKQIVSLKIMRFACPSDWNGQKTTASVFEKYLIYNNSMALEEIEPTIISWCKESPTLCNYINGKYVSEEDYNNEQEDEEGYNDFDPELYDEKFLNQLWDKLNEEPDRSFNLTNGDELINQIYEFQDSNDYIVLEHLYEIECNLNDQACRYIGSATYLDNFMVLLHAFTHYHSALTSAQAERCKEVIKVLKRIGVVQALPNEGIDLLAQLIKTNDCLLKNNEKICEFDKTCTFKEIKQIERNIIEERIEIWQKLLALYE
jgi:hypothetical protein